MCKDICSDLCEEPINLSRKVSVAELPVSDGYVQ